ncbi:MAG: sulfotransferase [Tahibacter sp.]
MAKPPLRTSADTPSRLLRLIRDASRYLDKQDIANAESAATCALALAPENPEVLYVFARAQLARGRPGEALACLLQVLETTPDDVRIRRCLADAHASMGAISAAAAELQRVADLQPAAASWFDLGVMHDRNASAAPALEASEKALHWDPAHSGARFLMARSLTALGRVAEAASQYRVLTERPSEAAKAWSGLLDLKTVPIADDELEAIQRIVDDPKASAADRMLAGFAAVQALEARHRYSEAAAHAGLANRLRRKTVHWDFATHHRLVDSVRAAFTTPPSTAQEQLGKEVVFIVGMPRSGTTLVEQILAAHPSVTGASELPFLDAVLGEESARRGKAFPAWASAATPSDWKRLGQTYLERTRRWQTTSLFTDKMPENWLYVGAILAMLPGARIIGCERDLVETCWSCYKQVFAPNRVAYSYDLDELAHYAHDSRRLWGWWRQLAPQHCYTASHETLLLDTENEVRRILAFCGLAYDPACLAFHAAKRTMNTASAAQVRQPLRHDTARSSGYAELFAPLRDALSKAAER